MTKRLLFYIKKPGLFFGNIYYRLRSLMKTETYDLIIIDDVFPYSLSAFRYEEFLAYLDHFGNRIAIFSTGHSLGALHHQGSIRSVIRQFRLRFPQHQDRVKPFQYHRKVKTKLAYVLFLDNAAMHLSYFEKNQIPFVFTLYPGAGFFIHQTTTDESLRRVMSSALFRGVITTQTISTDYLIQHAFCLPEQIRFIFGVVSPSRFFQPEESVRHYFHQNRMHVAFVANKQMPKGSDKGYDLFIESACKLASQSDSFVFHVVGPYSPDDMDVKPIGDHLIFHGYIETNDFVDFYKHIDVIVSPNRPFILKPGAFDGFPTGACTEASLNGVLMMVTDPLNLNIHYTSGKDIVIIEPDSDCISDQLMNLYQHQNELIQMAQAGKQTSKGVYSYESQIQPRIAFLEENTNPLL